jgi:hypothetical protein
MDELLDTWMDLGPSVAPSRIADATRTQIRITHQRRAFWPAWRLATMNNAFRIAVVAAGIFAAALIGYRLLANPGVGPGPMATASPTTTPQATSTPAARPYDMNTGGTSPIVVSVMLPDGWGGNGWYVSKNNAALGLYPVENVYGDPCHWSGSLPDPPVGPTVDELADALARQPTRRATATDVTLDGFSGKLVRMSVPADIHFSECDDGLFGSWSEAGSDTPSRYHQGPGQLDDIYIIDVDGTRVVLDAGYFPDTNPSTRAELDDIIASIDVQP